MKTNYHIEEISEKHIINTFDSGISSIDSFLKLEALEQNKDLLSKTFVVTLNNKRNVIAYFTLRPFILNNSESELIINKTSKRKVPGVLLAQLGVTRTYQNKPEKLGTQLVQTCFMYCNKILQYLNFAVVLVEPLNKELITYYNKFGFKLFKEDGKRMYVTTKKINNSLKEINK